MRALFVWEAPAPSPRPEPLTHREVMLLVDADLGVFDGVPATSPLGKDIRAAKAHRDAIEAWKLAPFASQPDIPIEGHRDGLSWGTVDVPPDAREWRTLMTTEPVSLGSKPLELFAECARFIRHRFRHGRRETSIFAPPSLGKERLTSLAMDLLGIPSPA